MLKRKTHPIHATVYNSDLDVAVFKMVSIFRLIEKLFIVWKEIIQFCRFGRRHEIFRCGVLALNVPCCLPGANIHDRLLPFTIGSWDVSC